MTQGYGPDNGQQGQQGQWVQQGHEGQQGQWGQQEQFGQGQQEQPASAPQWGQASPAAPAQQPQWGQPSPAAPAQPQWGQASPAGAPGGYPGSTGFAGPQFEAGNGVNWRRVKLIGLILLIGTAVLLLVRLGINLTTLIGAEDMAASDAGEELGAAGIGSSLASLLLYGVNFIVALALLALGITAAVMGRSRARVGGIVVAAAIPLSAVLYWITVFLAGVVFGIMGGSVDEPGSSIYVTTAVAGILHALVMTVIIGVGAFLVHSTARKNLSA